MKNKYANENSHNSILRKHLSGVKKKWVLLMNHIYKGLSLTISKFTVYVISNSVLDFLS